MSADLADAAVVAADRAGGSLREAFDAAHGMKVARTIGEKDRDAFGCCLDHVACCVATGIARDESDPAALELARLVGERVGGWARDVGAVALAEACGPELALSSSRMRAVVSWCGCGVDADGNMIPPPRPLGARWET